MKHGSELLRLWREDENLSQDAAAKVLDATPQQVSHWETRMHRPSGDRRDDIEAKTEGKVPARSWSVP